MITVTETQAWDIPPLHTHRLKVQPRQNWAQREMAGFDAAPKEPFTRSP